MLTLESGRLIIKASDLMIRSFLEAYSQDTTEEKEEASKLFTYIHLKSQTDPEAPFFRVSPYEIEAICKHEVYKDNKYMWHDSIYNPIQVEELIKEYIAAYSTPGDRVLKSFDKKIDELQKLADKTKPVINESVNSKTGKMEFTTNTKMITDTLLSVDKLMEARDTIVAKMKNESDKGTVRGQQEPSLLERKHDSK